MAWCAHCDRSVGTRGVTRRGELFCSRGCARRRHPPQFCDRCLRDTTRETTGHLSRTNGTGRTLCAVPDEWQCPDCGAQAVRVWFTVFWLPFYSCGDYLILWIDEPGFFGDGTFLSRRLR